MQPALTRHSDGLSSGIAYGAFKKTMPNVRTVGSNQFVEEPILTVMV